VPGIVLMDCDFWTASVAFPEGAAGRAVCGRSGFDEPAIEEAVTASVRRPTTGDPSVTKLALSAAVLSG
jgi:hypothetical protein